MANEEILPDEGLKAKFQSIKVNDVKTPFQMLPQIIAFIRFNSATFIKTNIPTKIGHRHSSPLFQKETDRNDCLNVQKKKKGDTSYLCNRPPVFTCLPACVCLSGIDSISVKVQMLISGRQNTNCSAWRGYALYSAVPVTSVTEGGRRLCFRRCLSVNRISEKVVAGFGGEVGCVTRVK